MEHPPLATAGPPRGQSSHSPVPAAFARRPSRPGPVPRVMMTLAKLTRQAPHLPRPIPLSSPRGHPSAVRTAPRPSGTLPPPSPGQGPLASAQGPYARRTTCHSGGPGTAKRLWRQRTPQTSRKMSTGRRLSGVPRGTSPPARPDPSPVSRHQSNERVTHQSPRPHRCSTWNDSAPRTGAPGYSPAPPPTESRGSTLAPEHVSRCVSISATPPSLARDARSIHSNPSST